MSYDEQPDATEAEIEAYHRECDIKADEAAICLEANPCAECGCQPRWLDQLAGILRCTGCGGPERFAGVEEWNRGKGERA